MERLSADDLIYGYVNGIFPMADNDGNLDWYSAEPRAIIPINTYKPSNSLRPILNKKQFEIRVNTNFEAVMKGCTQPRADSSETWISQEIIDAYCSLHQMGLAHSVEAYFENELVGGLYGVAIGAAFFGESMFYRQANASKVAFHYLIEILKKQGYVLLDTQFMNENVRRYGAIEIPKEDYFILLEKSIKQKTIFFNHVLSEWLALHTKSF